VYVAVGGDERGPVVSAAVACGAILVLGLSIAANLPVLEVSLVVTVILVMALGYKTLLRWHALLTMMILVILFIPIKRYELPGNLPFDLEPYRISVALVMAGWLISLLVDPRVRVRGSGLEGPLALIAFGSFASVLVNGPRIDELGVDADVVKGLMFLLSFLLVFYLIVSVTKTYDHVHFLVCVLVAGGGFVAGWALVEAWTGFNFFNHLSQFIPMLSLKEATQSEPMMRGSRLRVFASSQGAIPLGASLVMLVPLAIHLARTSKRPLPWWCVCLVITLGALATRSRTSVVMILVVLLVFLWLRPGETRRALALLLVPAILAVHVVLPGTIGTLRQSFFPEGGLIAQQSANPGWRGSGRIADLGPAMDEFVAQPLLGQGYGTRLTGRQRANAQILDNQWLKTMLETGVLGVVGWLWLFIRFARRLAPEARRDRGERGWLLVAIAASVTSFAVGMFFYDAFAFVQVTFILYILLGLGVALSSEQVRSGARARAAARLNRSGRAVGARGPSLPAPTH
jgi:polysaccharide biosynthesis protein PslJ